MRVIDVSEVDAIISLLGNVLGTLVRKIRQLLSTSNNLGKSVCGKHLLIKTIGYGCLVSLFVDGDLRLAYLDMVEVPCSSQGRRTKNTDLKP